METRKRRQQKNDNSRSYKNQTTNEYHAKRPPLFSLKTFLFIAFFLIIAIVSSNLLIPEPDLSRHVQHWRDSGYHFRFKQHDIFYQNIYKFKKKIKQEPVLLIIHGFPTSSYDFNGIITGLQQRFPHIVIPDLLGLGFSSKPAPYNYTVFEHADMIEELLAHLQISEVHVLSHDLGDTVAQELLSRQQDPDYKMRFSLKSLCLTNGGIIPSKSYPRPIQKLYKVPILRDILPFVSNRFVFYSGFAQVFGPATQPTRSELYDFYSIFAFNKGYYSAGHVLNYIADRHANEERWVSAIEKTKLPLHLIYGPLDPVNTPDGFLEEYKKRIKHSSITVLQNVSHYPQVEHPVGFVESYMKFLRRIERDFYLL